MKKTYIQPEMLMIRTAHTLPLCGSLSTTAADFIEEDASGSALVKPQFSGDFWAQWEMISGF
ncbi:MAG: hypothetical protein J5545_03785 [Bacteroidaceae bacterium]|nr:hypothetical protein [Bacteroidaceae bacterium]